MAAQIHYLKLERIVVNWNIDQRYLPQKLDSRKFTWQCNGVHFVLTSLYSSMFYNPSTSVLPIQHFIYTRQDFLHWLTLEARRSFQVILSVCTSLQYHITPSLTHTHRYIYIYIIIYIYIYIYIYNLPSWREIAMWIYSTSPKNINKFSALSYLLKVVTGHFIHKIQDCYTLRGNRWWFTPTQRASNEESVSMSWHLHDKMK